MQVRNKGTGCSGSGAPVSEPAREKASQMHHIARAAYNLRRLGYDLHTGSLVQALHNAHPEVAAMPELCIYCIYKTGEQQALV